MSKIPPINSYDKWAFEFFGIENFTGFCAIFATSAARKGAKKVPNESQIMASLWLFYVAFGGLSPVERRAAILRYRDGLSQIAIAAAVGVSQATISRALSHASRHFLGAVVYND